MTKDDIHLDEFLDSREDLTDLRPILKQLARERRDEGDDTKISDLLAQSAKNDAAYVTPTDIEKAEWVADLYEQEGRPEIHPRGFHYQLLGQGYETRNGHEYVNSNECWTELKEGFKWARILGLIDSDSVQDEESAEPTYTAFNSRADAGAGSGSAGGGGEQGGQQAVTGLGGALQHVQVHDGYQPPRIPTDFRPAKLTREDVDRFIEDAIDAIVTRAFDDLRFDPQRQQPYYIELWSEKSGVIDKSLVEEYGATIRPHSRGEFSLSMCQEALDIAAERGQDLAVITVTDFDGKGHDMPKSAARKLEVEAALRGVDVELTHAALTLEQVYEYGLPGEPSKTPQGLEYGNLGAKSYEKHKAMFRDYAGQYPVEIRAFKTRYPAAYNTVLEETQQEFYDQDLADRLEDALAEAKQAARDGLREAFAKHRQAIAAAFEDLLQAMADYQSRVEPDFEATIQGIERLERVETERREAAEVPQCRTDLASALREIDHAAAVEKVTVDLPEPAASGVADALLDTTRSLLEQLEFYKEHDMRYGTDDGDETDATGE